MTSALDLYQAALVVAVLVSGVAAGIAWFNRDQRGGTPLSVLLAGTTTWAGGVLAQTVWYGTPLVLFWNKVVLTSVAILIPSFLIFALSYTGREEYVTPGSICVLAVEPVVFGALTWTNGFHHLVWLPVEYTGTGSVGILMEPGPAYTVHTLYSYAILGLSVLLIVVFALRSQYLYRRQVTAIVVATLVPWFANVVYQVMSLTYDPTPAVFTVTALAFTWAVVREDFLDITPVATELVLDTIDTAVFVVDADGRVVEVNDRACELLGASTTEAVGTDARSLVAHIPNVRDMYEDLSKTREATSREFHAGDQYLRLQVSPLFGRRDALIGRVFLVVDLTDRRRREEQLQRRNEQLDQFVGVVSHDLRNPLGVASSSLKLARETGADEDFERAERAHERMDRLIEDLLTLARENRDPGLTTVDLAEVARAAWKYVDTADATLEAGAVDLQVEADRDRLIQLFENLFRNAIEHGGTDVTVTVEPLSGGFAVSDDGSGFDAADADVMFDEGFTTAADGTGFGLAIVAEIVDTHGWDVSASGSDAGGARFEFRVDGRDRS